MAIPTAAEEPKATVKYAEIVGGETPHHQAQELAASLYFRPTSGIHMSQAGKGGLIKAA